MPNATARYVITADDNTKAAIASVRRGFTSLDRSAKTLGRTITGLGTGAAFYGLARIVKGVFGNIAQSNIAFANSLEAVKKNFKELATPSSGVAATTKAMNELAKTLADPQVKAAGDSLFSTLIIGATKLAQLTAATVRNLSIIGRDIGLVDGGKSQRVDDLIVEISRRRANGGRTGAFPGFREGGDKTLDQLEAELYALQTKPTRPSRVRGNADLRSGAGFNIADEDRNRELRENPPLGQLNIGLNARAAELVDGMKLEGFGDSLIESTEGIADRMGEALKEPFAELTPYAADVARSMDSAFADFFRNADGGFKGLARSVADTFRDIIAQIAAVKLRMAIFGNVDDKGNLSGGLLSAGINALFGGFGGGKAAGGPVSAGTSYLVGERGPELFTPGRSGVISPNASEKRALTVHVTNNVNASQLTQDQAARMVADSQRMMWDELDRRYGLA